MKKSVTGAQAAFSCPNLITMILLNLQIETFPATHSSLLLNTPFLVDEVTATQDKDK